MACLYEAMKGKVYGLATNVTGKTNSDAQAVGFKDVYDYIMSDSDDPCQPLFTQGLQVVLSEKQRQVLLDGMAKEYAGVNGYLAYVDRECS